MRLSNVRIRKLRRNSDDPEAGHALAFSCFRRRQFLTREHACKWLFEALDSARREHQFDLWAFVVMSERVHLIIWARGPQFRIRAVMAAIKLPVSRLALAFARRNAPQLLPQMLDEQQYLGGSAYRIWQRGGGYDRDLHEPGMIHAGIGGSGVADVGCTRAPSMLTRSTAKACHPPAATRPPSAR